ncbi:N-acetyltransferase family protein [Staphylococcus xylosus]|uniref:GNAT family N-acetyltransferase n=1 Tax=Staphylococcus xylosus TaxID=1288 RepID=A0AAQ0M0B0_STAXY|nr:GNAT family N-acetyltransferase [Staphylococcus xylosus]MCE7785936.1 GNAT family N-acetyltransferase [Staphylococcus xylosus]MCM3518066.1 GNAT family N-acetyltransferase [Staphylococcus xylosus]MCQ3816154.1 GNAT family N-acetyltransferase [Staphylococcus xylosus]MCQ3818750.1 GNAT family N-acetyltransferase [Staphylococcus xylosus]PTH97508.1 GNAT family N-acetyltransferase [Staphylococcus xylosus]
MEQLSLSQNRFIEEIANIHEQQLEQQYYDYKKTNLSVALRIEMIERSLKLEAGRILIQTLDGVLQGFVWARIEAVGCKVVIEMLYVHPEYRHLSIGAKLKSSIESWGISQGAQKIESTVAYSNKQMIEMNLNMDYQVEKIIMSKKLSVINEDNNN